MNNSLLPIVIGLLVIIGVGGFVMIQNADAPREESAPLEAAPVTTMAPAGEIEDNPDRIGTDDDVPAGTGTAGASGTANEAPGTYTTATVAQHGSPSSCWSIINGNVYDLTSWIPKHPGGPEKITQLCGKDGSAKFNGQHGGQSRMETVLAGFKIGVVTP